MKGIRYIPIVMDDNGLYVVAKRKFMTANKLEAYCATIEPRRRPTGIPVERGMAAAMISPAATMAVAELWERPKFKEGDKVRLRPGTIHRCPDGRDNHSTAHVAAVLADGGIMTDRDLRGCRYWHVEDLKIAD